MTKVYKEFRTTNGDTVELIDREVRSANPEHFFINGAPIKGIKKSTWRYPWGKELHCYSKTFKSYKLALEIYENIQDRFQGTIIVE